MTLRALLSTFLVLGMMLVPAAPQARADHDDDDNYRWRSRRVYRSYNTYPNYVPPGPYGYRRYGYAPFRYRTYTTYNPYWNSGYRYYDDGRYRYYRNSTGDIIGRVLLTAIASGAFR